MIGASLSIPSSKFSARVAGLLVPLLLLTSAVAQEGGTDAVDVDQIRRELAALKLGEQGDGAALQARQDFAVGTAELSKKEESLRSAEQDLLEELRRAEEPPASVTSSSSSATSDLAAASSDAIPVNERGRLDLEKIRERAVRKADLKENAPASSPIREAPAQEAVAKNGGDPIAGLLGDGYEEAFPEKSAPSPVPSLEKIAKENSDLKSARATVSSLQAKLAASERARAALAKNLEEARNRLMIAETEVERLSSLVERRATTAARTVAASQPVVVAESAPPAQTRTVYSPLPRNEQNMLVATVVVDKANLRAGPSIKDTQLMSISKGARLIVETRKGEWYRVVAPTGARAWISAETVAFGRDGFSSPSSTVRVKSYDEDVDNDGFSRTKAADN